MLILLFLSSGLFLGWSLGANDAANIFGTAVGSKMIKFRTAAIIAGIFVILGAGLSGSGASHTLGKLGLINEIAGSFIVALAAAVTVYWMTRLRLPASTSQAIVGAIIGWNIFTASIIDFSSLIKIGLAWVFSPIITAIISIILYWALRTVRNRMKIHLIWQDVFNRVGLIIVGAFGAYSLGANNIANVMGVFVPVSPFKPIDLNIISISSSEQLFLMGGVAIAIGIFTYSKKVMATVGTEIFKLNPSSALVVVLSSSIVLFLFASERLQYWLASNSLPSIPLVPLSSSQVVVGGVIGIGIFYGGKNINYKILGKIASGWVIAPIIACIISFISLFFFQNVFDQKVFRPVEYILTTGAYNKLIEDKINIRSIEKIKNQKYRNAEIFNSSLIKHNPKFTGYEINKIINRAEVHRMKVKITGLNNKDLNRFLSSSQKNTLSSLNNKTYIHKWQLYDELSRMDENWCFKKDKKNKKFNKMLKSKLEYLYRAFRAESKK